MKGGNILKYIKKIKMKNVRKVFVFTAFITMISIIVLLFFLQEGMSSFMSLFVKDLAGCSVFSFALSQSTHFFEKKVK